MCLPPFFGRMNLLAKVSSHVYAVGTFSWARDQHALTGNCRCIPSIAVPAYCRSSGLLRHRLQNYHQCGFCTLVWLSSDQVYQSVSYRGWPFRAGVWLHSTSLCPAALCEYPALWVFLERGREFTASKYRFKHSYFSFSRSADWSFWAAPDWLCLARRL